MTNDSPSRRRRTTRVETHTAADLVVERSDNDCALKWDGFRLDRRRILEAHLDDYWC